MLKRKINAIQTNTQESTNFMRSTTLYNKMTNMSLTLLKYMNFLIIYKNKKVKICIFSFLFLLQSKQRKDRIFTYSSSLFFLYPEKYFLFSFISFLPSLPLFLSLSFPQLEVQNQSQCKSLPLIGHASYLKENNAKEETCLGLERP